MGLGEVLRDGLDENQKCAPTITSAFPLEDLEFVNWYGEETFAGYELVFEWEVITHNMWYRLGQECGTQDRDFQQWGMGVVGLLF